MVPLPLPAFLYPACTAPEESDDNNKQRQRLRQEDGGGARAVPRVPQPPPPGLALSQAPSGSPRPRSAGCVRSPWAGPSRSEEPLLPVTAGWCAGPPRRCGSFTLILNTHSILLPKSTEANVHLIILCFKEGGSSV
ncbi:unnamed protein product [Natator depressus]